MKRPYCIVKIFSKQHCFKCNICITWYSGAVIDEQLGDSQYCSIVNTVVVNTEACNIVMTL